MSNVLILVKRTAVAGMVAGGIIAAGGIGVAVRILDPFSAEAAIPHHAMMSDAPRRPPIHAAAAANEIVIDNFSFGPAQLKVPAGTKVVWTNDDSDPHTIVSEADPKLFKSPPLDTGDSFAFTFDKLGTYRYFCTIHPRMQGTVVVE
jgi:plastocyanin